MRLVFVTACPQVLCASVAATPRTMTDTIKMALKYAIDPIAEPNLVWLADLATSLPVPAGWIQVSLPLLPCLTRNALIVAQLQNSQILHPKERIYFWYNELTRISRYLFLSIVAHVVSSPKHGMTYLSGCRWQHPVDDFIKTNIGILRTPRHPVAMTARSTFDKIW